MKQNTNNIGDLTMELDRELQELKAHTKRLNELNEKSEYEEEIFDSWALSLARFIRQLVKN